MRVNILANYRFTCILLRVR